MWQWRWNRDKRYSFSESTNTEEPHLESVKSGKTNEIYSPVWLREKQSGNNLKRRGSVHIVKKKSGPVGKAKRTKNGKSCIELFISKNMLETIVEFTNTAMEKTRNKSELTIDYRTMNTNIDEIRCLIAVVLLFRVCNDTKKIQTNCGIACFHQDIFTKIALTLNATNGWWKI